MAFYAINREGNTLEATIHKDEKPASTIGSRLQKEKFYQITGAHTSNRENINYLNLKASVAKVRIQLLKHKQGNYPMEKIT